MKRWRSGTVRCHASADGAFVAVGEEASFPPLLLLRPTIKVYLEKCGLLFTRRVASATLPPFPAGTAWPLQLDVDMVDLLGRSIATVRLLVTVHSQQLASRTGGSKTKASSMEDERSREWCGAPLVVGRPVLDAPTGAAASAASGAPVAEACCGRPDDESELWTGIASCGGA